MSVGQCACVVCDGGVGGVCDGGGDSFPSESMFRKKDRSPWKRETDTAEHVRCPEDTTQDSTQGNCVYSLCTSQSTLMPSLTKQQLTNHYKIKTQLQ